MKDFTRYGKEAAIMVDKKKVKVWERNINQCMFDASDSGMKLLGLIN